MFEIQKKVPGSNWYKYTTSSSEYSATISAENGKRAFPTCAFRVLNSNGNVVYIT
jgi:hypothetical protein